MITIGIPTIISMTLESCTEIIDKIFVGNLPSIGANALTAMGIISPILIIFISAQLFFGFSTSVIISRYIGENNIKKANIALTCGIIATFIISTFISFISYIFLDNILLFFGASEEIFVLGKQYMSIMVISNIFSSLGYTISNSLRSFGMIKFQLPYSLSLAIINIISNIILSFIFDFGIVGIAIGTLISEIIGFLVPLILIILKKYWKFNILFTFKIFVKNFIDIIKIGFVEFLMLIMGAITISLTNGLLLRLASQEYIGVYTITSSVESLFSMPLIGFGQGAQTILSYFNGKKDKIKMKEVFTKFFIMVVVFSFCAGGIIFMNPNIIISMFTNNQIFIDISSTVLKITIIGSILTSLGYCFILLFQCTGKENRASKMVLFTDGFLCTLFLLTIPFIVNLMNISIPGFYFIFISPGLASLIGFLISLYIYNKENRLENHNNIIS